MGLVEKAVYRAVLRKARLFDKNIAAKALIQRHGIVRPPLTDSDAIGGDRRLYAAALEVVVGSHCHVRPERLAWSLQRLIRTIRMADQNNLEVVADRAAENEAKEAEGVPLEDRTVWEQDAMVAISLEMFFPGALKGVDEADKIGAGFAAIRELSSKWALAESLGLTDDLENNGQTPCVKRRRRKKVAGPRNTTTKRALRVLRHQEQRVRVAGELNTRSPSPLSAGRGFEPDTRNSLARSGVVVEPTGTPAKGVYLISHPLSFLNAPEEMFHRSVVLLVDHSPLGSYGLVVNKDKGETLEEALCEDALPLASDALQQVLKNPVRVGGPVMSRLAWLHPYKEVGGVPLAEGAEKPVFFCGKMEKAAELLTKGTAKPADFSLVVGASAWDAGQLQGELNHGLWIMAKAPASFALAGGEDMWRDMLEAMGGPYAAMSRVPHGRQWARAGVKMSPSDWP